MTTGSEIGWVGWISAATAVVAGAMLVMHLARRPSLEGEAGRNAKLWLLVGLGFLPNMTAGTANLSGVEALESRRFCASCHVMEPHANDSQNPKSNSLAAIHARNANFGADNCYGCHKDYGMYGYVLTKAGGMRHVYYYVTEYWNMPLSESKHAIRINKPLPNTNCMDCHTTTAPRWLRVPDHASALDQVRAGTVSCASPGCHGYAHPVTKLGKELPLDTVLP